ncbi:MULTISPECIES: DNA primase DnaG [Haloarcula]|uniref:DNA primase DnaG n=1 Tax=Haloarcula pellucida TaxID=1427151 RepID=A0A830GRD0_9EURY|nr:MULTISPECIES: DNA primase DnaG [Halomicroarcula]MBX0348309.1 DNA primase [Halomicroarcula pellucida]MDS0278134.1 DNA primase DnaG [Halomicroarcula sp. S1AR25-4]GGN97947.1 DNA primase [Halomicroarcula pellucida]
MHDTAKYLIHADITAAGVVERSDVVGAVFGQTEGLLGEELDLRDLQDSKKVGRIDVEIRSESGQSFGQITVASGLDKVETAILAAALETIEQIGPCRAEIAVSDIEDVRSAKRREVVDRATELLAAFEEQSVQTEDIVETVRQRARVEDITEYEGLPAGPRVADSDAIVVVEGRSDVLQLLKYGVKNAIAVEGTDVPEAVAELTNDRTVTAFLDGDRGGDLILKELAQVGQVDYVAVAPRGHSVEDLSRGEAMKALRDKVPYDTVADADSPEAALEAVETSADGAGTVDGSQTGADETVAESAAAVSRPDPVSPSPDERVAAATGGQETATPNEDDSAGDEDATEEETADPAGLSDHVDAVIRSESGTVRLLDEDLTVLAEGDADDVVSLVESCDGVPRTIVLDDICSQKVVDVAAQRGVDVVVATGDGEYVKQPTSVQVRTVG